MGLIALTGQLQLILPTRPIGLIRLI